MLTGGTRFEEAMRLAIACAKRCGGAEVTPDDLLVAFAGEAEGLTARRIR